MRSLILFCLLPVLLFAQSSEEVNKTTISADLANYEGSIIELIGSVRIENPMGVVKAGSATLTKDTSGSGAIDFPYIELVGDVEATLSDNSTLFCDALTIDCIASIAHFEAEEGLRYSDERGRVTADEADLFFRKEEGQFFPIKVLLRGNVKMQSAEEIPLSCALAEKVEIFPNQKTMVLFGSPVLFYDKEQKMQLSAYKVEAKRDLETGEESVQGFGKVHFVFAQEEFEKLKLQFDIAP